MLDLKAMPDSAAYNDRTRLTIDLSKKLNGIVEDIARDKDTSKVNKHTVNESNK